MSNFPNQQITDNGWLALADALIGKRLLFVRMVAGDGHVDDPEDLSKMEELSNYVMDIPMTDYTVDGFGRALIVGTLLSSEVPQGFYFREVGLYCTIDGGPQILYSAANAVDEASFIPGQGDVSAVINSIELHIIIGEADIEVVIEAGESTGGENIGPDSAGAGIFAQKAGVMLQFKRLAEGEAIQITDRGTTLEIASEGVPVGTVLPYAGANAPVGFLFCLGQAVSRAQYPALYVVLGDVYGEGDGSTTFNVPDMRGRCPVGAGGLDGGPDPWIPGMKYGDETVTLTPAQIPAHQHRGRTQNHAHGVYDPQHIHFLNDPQHQHTFSDGGHGHGYTTIAFGSGNNVLVGGGIQINAIAANTAASGVNAVDHWRATGCSVAYGVSNVLIHETGDIGDWSDATGGGQAHENTQPSLGLNFIIRT
jgi:microcystin-dependent protein